MDKPFRFKLGRCLILNLNGVKYLYEYCEIVNNVSYTYILLD